jgi:probable rRNA maturation factor
MAKTALPKKYDISVHFVGRYKIQKLNSTYRKKTYATDILSFPYSDSSGEIFIYLEKVASKAKQFNVKPNVYLEQLFIHGLLHLKGYEHGSTMEAKEELLRIKLKLPKIPWH